MSSLISTPKAASVPIIVQAPTPTPVTASQSSEASTSETVSASEVREANLLKRDRSRFGTVATSFRGFLDLADRNNSNRKTLLGE